MPLVLATLLRFFAKKRRQGVFDDRKQVHGSSASAPGNFVIWVNWNRFDNLLGCL